jgi:hypothetical protein
LALVSSERAMTARARASTASSGSGSSGGAGRISFQVAKAPASTITSTLARRARGVSACRANCHHNSCE